MKIVHRYLLREFLSLLGLSLVIFTSIYLLVEFFERVDDFIEHQARLVDALTYFFYRLPFIFTQTAPFAVLLATVLTLTFKARSQETTAMRCAGMSLVSIGKPMFWCAVVVSLLLAAAHEVVMPLANTLVDRTMREKVEGNEPRGVFRDNDIWYRDRESRLWHVRYFHRPTNSLHGLTIYMFNENHQLRRRLDAEHAFFEGGAWRFVNAYVHEFTPDGDVQYEYQPTLLRTFPEEPGDFLELRKKPENMTLREIYRFVQRAREHGLDDTRYTVDLQNKLAQPWAPILMVLIGLPFSLRPGRRSGTALGIAVTLGLSLAYFVILSLSLTAGYDGLLPALLAAWMPNLVFAAAGAYLLASFPR